jgi:hypothetical protein
MKSEKYFYPVFNHTQISSLTCTTGTSSNALIKSSSSTAPAPSFAAKMFNILKYLLPQIAKKGFHYDI